jgi:hypothetical protein
VTILRGSTFDDAGDELQDGVPVYSGVLAWISSPAQSPFRPIVFGTTAYEPASQVPTTVREIPCNLPGHTDITDEDQILDERSGIVYAILTVTQPGDLAGMVPDMQLTLKRVTTVQPI